jgi:WD40 repeat protein
VLLVVTGAAVFWPDRDNAPAAGTSGSRPTSSAPAPPSPSPVSTSRAFRVLKTPDWAQSVSFSPDGKALAAGAEGGSIRLWNMPGGGLVTTLKVKARTVPLVAYRPNGKSLISTQWDGSVRLWNVASRSSSVIMPSPDGSGGIAVRPDGTMVARSEGKKIRLWDVTKKRTARVLSGHTKSVGSVAFSQDGKLLASSSTLSDTVRIWDVASGRSLQEIPSEDIAIFTDALAFSPDGKTLAKSNDKNSIQLWDVASGKPTATFTNEEDDSYYSLAFSPDGRTLAAGTGKSGIQLWNVASARVTTIFSGHELTVGGLDFSSDGRTLASAGNDKTVRLWAVP